MNYKKYIKYFIIISVIIISILPAYNFYQYSKKYDFKKLYNLDGVEKYINYSVYKIFNRSLVQDSVITGKDDFLFLGNKYNNTLHKTNGTYRPSKKEIDGWTNKLKKLQQWYEDKGIEFIIVIAPNKSSIYKEKLPNWMNYDGKTITDDIVASSNTKKINMLDLRGLLISKKNKSLLYTKHGTHWNNIGASIAYNETIDYLNNKYSNNLKKIQFTTSDFFRGASPLGNMMKTSKLINIDDNTYKYNIKTNEIVLRNITKKNFIIEKKEEIIINRNIWTNRQGKNIFNANAINNVKLLFLCDSFSATRGKSIIGNSILYSETFSKINKLHYGHINGAKLSKFIFQDKPDIVIYQIVERSLYNHGIVKAFPRIIDTKKSNANDKIIFDFSKNKG